MRRPRGRPRGRPRTGRPPSRGLSGSETVEGYSSGDDLDLLVEGDAACSGGIGARAELLEAKEELRDLCTQVFGQISEHKKNLDEIFSRGWPRFEKQEQGGTVVVVEDGDQRPLGRREEGGPHFRVRVRPTPIGQGIERGAGEASSSKGVEVLPESRVHDPLASFKGGEFLSTAATQLMDAVAGMARTKIATGRKVDEERLRSELEGITLDVLPRMLLHMYTLGKQMPAPEALKQRPWKYETFARKMDQNFTEVLCQAGKKVGLSRDFIEGAVDKFTSTLEKQEAEEDAGRTR
ncbi:hypothetical protein HOP50_05g36690 [Chloropicon primus]|uniref:Uncharacterized protein n=1 Tax=Chloropicon primus TaxID=1764295 RepID=A0A5B8MLF8_9CHLO|nr:hypothetical protein A3770_05p36590 [Chloropicon primus]UPR00355.1 hypothetical protein HOP50_05g36690 [Chloropicon primus]|mmetsp:Transcript_12954/g.36321  ORF Transcript_12954/g.36321 Transcript_12954/m.36321 type:complete len:293 (-) Transcript_12954:586-1464(-)|eukprot:QDZ21141.1 hypothetical protein A3770_05p36590 [Chloropicon primus]